MIDLNKLTLDPWVATAGKVGDVAFGGDDESAIIIEDDDSDGRDGKHIALMFSDASVDAEFVILARKSFGVMMRRGWHAERSHRPDMTGKWIVYFEASQGPHRNEEKGELFFDDPFTALVEADKWYKENVEKQ